MITRNLGAIAASAAALAPPGIAASEETKAMQTMINTAPVLKDSGNVEVRGVSYYYEIRGEGEPLLLLHGGLGTVDMFAGILPILAEGREIISVELQGHGRSTLGNRPIRLPALADDVASVLEHLGYEQMDVLGYSMGGGVALRLAIQHPTLVRRLALVSTGFHEHGFYPELLPQQAQVGAALAPAMKDTPMYQSYAAVSPRPEDFPRLLDAMGDWMRQPYNWADEVGTLEMPVMLVYGDSDMFQLEHALEFYHLLGGGLRDAGWQREHMGKNRLAILPNLTHYEMSASAAMAHTVRPFLDGVSEAKSWADEVREQQR